MKKYFFLTLCIIFIPSILLASPNNRSGNTNPVQSKIDIIKSLLPSKSDSAILLTEKLLIENRDKTDSIDAIGNYLLGMAYYFKGNYFLSISFYKQALNSKYAKTNKNFTSICYNNLGINMELTDQYKEALSNYIRSTEIELELDNQLGAAETKLNIGLLYNHLNEYDKAQTYFRESLQYFQEIESHQNMGLALHNLGKVHMDKNNYDSALIFLEKSNLEFLKVNNAYERGMLLNNLILTHIELNNFDQAKYYLKESEDIISDNNFKYLESTHLTTKAEYYINIGEIEKAEKTNQSIKVFNSRTKKKVFNQLIRIEILKGNTQLATNKLIQYTAYLDSLNQVNHQKLVNELHIQYNTQKRLETINEQEGIIKRKRKTNNMMIVFSIIVSFLFIGLVIIYRRLQQSYHTLYNKSIKNSDEFKSHIDLLKKDDSSNAQLWNCIIEKLKKEQLWKNPKLTIEELAQHCNSNKSYISNTIKENSNENFTSLINHFRIEEAKNNLIKNSEDFTIEAIAQMSGFNSTSSFYRIFKEFTGITPKRFIQHSKSETTN